MARREGHAGERIQLPLTDFGGAVHHVCKVGGLLFGGDRLFEQADDQVSSCWPIHGAQASLVLT